MTSTTYFEKFGGRLIILLSSINTTIITSHRLLESFGFGQVGSGSGLAYINLHISPISFKNSDTQRLSFPFAYHRPQISVQ